MEAGCGRGQRPGADLMDQTAVRVDRIRTDQDEVNVPESGLGPPVGHHAGREASPA